MKKCNLFLQGNTSTIPMGIGLYPDMLKLDFSKGKGVGVFALCDIEEGQIFKFPFSIHLKEIEENDIYLKLRSFPLSSNIHRAFVQGEGSFFNHKDPSDLITFKTDEVNNFIYFKAVRPLKMGSELFISYGKHYNIIFKKLWQ